MGKFGQLNVGFEAVYVGGVPDSIRERISKELAHVENATSLVGCLSGVHVNSELRDLDDVEYSHRVRPGCSFLEACNREKEPCKNGAACTNVFSLDKDYECSCAEGFSGDSCQMGAGVAVPQYRAIALTSEYLWATLNGHFLLGEDNILGDT